MLEPDNKISRVFEDTRQSYSLHTLSVKKIPETARGLFLSVCADPLAVNCTLLLFIQLRTTILQKLTVVK